jgi:Asp-tRNA(Asn)/Glu-tRNA(Gln) amidotransferase A subunit family amidase
VTKLRAKVTQSREALAARENEIKGMRQALTNEGEFVSYNGSRYERKAVEDQVRMDAMRFLADEKLVKADEENLKILEETLETNKAKLNGLALQRKAMEAQLAELERQLAQERLKEQSSMVIDDGRYGQIRKQIEEARDRLELQKTKSELRGDSGVGSVRAQEERKAREQKIDKEIEARFGTLDGRQKVSR